jgi:hypothetical protein
MHIYTNIPTHARVLPARCRHESPYRNTSVSSTPSNVCNLRGAAFLRAKASGQSQYHYYYNNYYYHYYHYYYYHYYYYYYYYDYDDDDYYYYHYYYYCQNVCKLRGAGVCAEGLQVVKFSNVSFLFNLLLSCSPAATSTLRSQRLIFGTSSTVI